MNKQAQALGRLAKGIPKTLSNAERKRRAKQMELINKRRRARFAKQKKDD